MSSLTPPTLPITLNTNEITTEIGIIIPAIFHFRKITNHAEWQHQHKYNKKLFSEKKGYAQIPLRVEYSLTTRSKRSIKMIEQIRDYGLKLMEEFGFNMIEEKKKSARKK